MHKVLSIEIGVITTKICEMDYRKKSPKIYRSIIFNTPENAIEDGFIRDKSKFAEILKAQLVEHKFKVKDVVFTISSNKILSREVMIPLVKDNQIAAVVEAEAHEYFPRDITDHVVTYTVLDKQIEEQKILLLAYAAPSNLVRSYYSLAEYLNLSVVAVDYVGNSSYQWLKKTASTECDFVLQINEENSIVTIMNDGVLLLQRSINYGTNILAEALLETNAFQVEELAAATELLQKEEILMPRFLMNILKEDLSDTMSTYARMQKAKEAITDSMQLFVNNISRIIEYQMTRSHQTNIPINIKEIILAGSGSLVKGLGMLISNELAIPVRTKKEIMNVTLGGDTQVPQQRIPEFLTCFGATIAPVNFVPKDFVVTVQKRNFWMLYAALFLATVLISAVLVFMARQNYIAALDRQADLEESNQEMSYIVDVYTNSLAAQETYNSLQAVEDSTYSYLEEFNLLLGELEKKLPSGSIVHSFSSDNSSFTMSISTATKEVATQLLLQLQQIPYILDTQITGLTETKDSETGVSEVTFSVTCYYTKPSAEEVAQ